MNKEEKVIKAEMLLLVAKVFAETGTGMIKFWFEKIAERLFEKAKEIIDER